MTNIEFFKLQAKNLFSDYKSRMYNDSDGTYDYFPRFCSFAYYSQILLSVKNFLYYKNEIHCLLLLFL